MFMKQMKFFLVALMAVVINGNVGYFLYEWG